MNKKWITIAPNGKSILISINPFIDKTFLHRQVMTDKVLAEQYPHLFKQYIAPEITKKQMLTEVPNVEKFESEKDKPTVTKQDGGIILKEITKTDDSKILNETKDSLELMTKKQLQDLAKDRKIEISKITNKTDIIAALGA